jgi:membrane protease YdiL (CAAX protease family)
MARDFLIATLTVVFSALSLIGIVSVARIFGIDPKELNGPHFVMTNKNVVTVLAALVVPTLLVIYGNTWLQNPSKTWLGLREMDWGNFIFGLLIGAAILSASYLLRTLVWGVPTISMAVPSDVGMASLWPFIFWAALTLILNSISEELVYRVLPLFVSKQHGIGSALATIILSLLFAGIHFITRTPSISDFTYLFLYGAVFCLLYSISQSFWFVVGVHTGSNIVVMLFTGNWKIGGFLKIQWPSETPIQSYTLSFILLLVILGLLARYRDALRIA